MHVAFAADGPRVAQAPGDSVDGLNDVSPGLGLRVEGVELPQAARRQDGPGPGAEVLGREVVAADRAQILIDVVRLERAEFAGLVFVLEQELPRQVLAAGDDAGQAAIVNL